MFEWLIVSSLQFVVFGSVKKMMFTKLLLDKEMDVAGNIDKNVFEIMTLPNNLVLICRVKDYDLVFFSLCMIREMFFLLNYGS